MTDPRKSAIEHAARCREAISAGTPRPLYDGPSLSRADLSGADLSDADLSGADLSGAYLRGAYLSDADMSDTTVMPDGRPWSEYRRDHLAGICSEPDVVERVRAAWGNHEWTNCPMHAGLGIDGFDDIDDAEKRLRVAAWVALYDGGHLQPPGEVAP